MKADYTSPPTPPVLFLRGERVGRVIGRLPDGSVRVERWAGLGEVVADPADLREQP